MNDNETQRIQQTREYAVYRNNDVQNTPAVEPDEWLVQLLDKRVRPVVDTGESRLYIHVPFTGPNEADRYRLRLRHPDTSESDISPALDAGEFESYLFGLIHGLNGEIEHKSVTTEEDSKL